MCVPSALVRNGSTFLGLPESQNMVSLYGGTTVNKYIPSTRIERIFWSLSYTDKEYVEYYDGFFHMPQIEEAWNLNMAEEFNPSWINVLDEIMMELFNKYDPGLMWSGRKPHSIFN